MNLPQRDNTNLRLVAPAGGVTSGVPVAVGNIVVLPQSTEDAGEIFTGLVRGYIKMAKKTGETWGLGDHLYFDPVAESLTKTDSGALLRVGKPTEAVAGASVVSAWVLFDGGAGAEAGLPGDITGVTAGAGLTGGGTSGTVTVTVDTTIHPTATTFASVANGEGASLIGIEDAAGTFAATNVEAALAEIPAALSSVANGEGASLIGLEDAAGDFTATDVEAALAELFTGAFTWAGIQTLSDTPVLSQSAEIAHTDGTAAAGAVTINDYSGTVTTASLTTAAGAIYTLTLTNSTIDANSMVFASIRSGTNTTAPVLLTEVQPGAGTCDILILNGHGGNALNGTLLIDFMVINPA